MGVRTSRIFSGVRRELAYQERLVVSLNLGVTIRSDSYHAIGPHDSDVVTSSRRYEIDRDRVASFGDDDVVVSLRRVVEREHRRCLDDRGGCLSEPTSFVLRYLELKQVQVPLSRVLSNKECDGDHLRIAAGSSKSAPQAGLLVCAYV